MKVTSTAQWTIEPGDGLDGLHLDHSAPVPELGEHSCLVQIEAVSLNYRDVAIPKGKYPMKFRDNLIPCSDAAGSIIATGGAVTLFRAGDRVCTLFNQSHQSGYFKPETRNYSLGSNLDGVLRRYAVFEETGLIAAPQSLTTLEASTLPCAATTVWNAFYGVVGRSLKPGHHVLTQGTGGVSLFAIQIALAAGATVISTTSSAEKMEKLKAMGVQHVINYKEDPNWGDTARHLTPDGAGVEHVIEVGGERTMKQSLKVIKMEGVISIVGFLGGKADEDSRCSFGDCLAALAIVRGMSVGSKKQFEELNAFIDEHQIKPVMDDRVFRFEEAREAFQYLWDQKQWGKIVIQL